MKARRFAVMALIGVLVSSPLIGLLNINNYIVADKDYLSDLNVDVDGEKAIDKKLVADPGDRFEVKILFDKDAHLRDPERLDLRLNAIPRGFVGEVGCEEEIALKKEWIDLWSGYRYRGSTKMNISLTNYKTSDDAFIELNITSGTETKTKNIPVVPSVQLLTDRTTTGKKVIWVEKSGPASLKVRNNLDVGFDAYFTTYVDRPDWSVGGIPSVYLKPKEEKTVSFTVSPPRYQPGDSCKPGDSCTIGVRIHGSGKLIGEEIELRIEQRSELSVSPKRIDLKGAPGEKTEYIEIENRGDGPDIFSIRAEGEISFKPVETVDLASKEIKNVKITISVPSIPAGEVIEGIIIVESIYLPDQAKETIPIALTVGGSPLIKITADVEKAKYNETKMVNLTAKNEGNVATDVTIQEIKGKGLKITSQEVPFTINLSSNESRVIANVEVRMTTPYYEYPDTIPRLSVGLSYDNRKETHEIEIEVDPTYPDTLNLSWTPRTKTNQKNVTLEFKASYAGDVDLGIKAEVKRGESWEECVCNPPNLLANRTVPLAAENSTFTVNTYLVENAEDLQVGNYTLNFRFTFDHMEPIKSNVTVPYIGDHDVEVAVYAERIKDYEEGAVAAGEEVKLELRNDGSFDESIKLNFSVDDPDIKVHSNITELIKKGDKQNVTIVLNWDGRGVRWFNLTVVWNYQNIFVEGKSVDYQEEKIFELILTNYPYTPKIELQIRNATRTDNRTEGELVLVNSRDFEIFVEEVNLHGELLNGPFILPPDVEMLLSFNLSVEIGEEVDYTITIPTSANITGRISVGPRPSKDYTLIIIVIVVLIVLVTLILALHVRRREKMVGMEKKLEEEVAEEAAEEESKRGEESKREEESKMEDEGSKRNSEF
jgi:hypothetical protein